MTTAPHRFFQQQWPKGEFTLVQLGFVVDNLLAAAESWVTTFGIGPFHVMPRTQIPCTYRSDETASLDTRLGVAQAGPVQIELIEDLTDGPTIYHEMRDRYGARPFGIHQLSTLTADFDGKKRHYEQAGHELACEINAQGQRVAFYDTYERFGFYTEVIADKPSLRADLANIAKTCATWDGRDPIRILTREGYTTP
jgi:hypothetical protein